MPTLIPRELVYVTDEQALYIGTSKGNVKLCSAELIAAVVAMSAAVGGNTKTIQELKTSLDNKLTASPVAAQATVAADADTAAVITAVNNLIAAMKASGVMNE